jgi:hypothetical protein
VPVNIAQKSLFDEVKVRIPTKLSREKRKVFERLWENLPAAGAEDDKGGLFGKVKNLFN